MAQVILSGELAAIAGVREARIDAVTVRALLRELEQQFPALAGRLDELAIAIDGEIIQAPLLETLAPDSEVHFLAPIEGG